VDKENMGYIHNGELFNHKKEQNCVNHVVCRKMNEIGDHHVE
jgi:hypothetical protein